MSFSFNSQISEKEYSIQITTDNYEQFLFIQEMARQCVDGQHKEKQGDTETFAEHYGSLPFDWKKFYQLDSPAPNATLRNDIPNCCKGCTNHPSNGGSGICNCTAPYFEKGHGLTCIVQTSDILKD